ncbi:hypothetical protein SmJEL517_g03549 [Synchytrium microbalum]|uniref:J domain-containing protein n=1 Tax=Synchytrium microbalum TaxID=1806994 RepID=A0A507C7U4_9FUNG|nr:uncharacterized protein SmJEL517_g03549 [Synchytrium microbalum]TPX33565.1 hypothetical protein SmJEL517_g03549 [Synchytrium microbalum]
MTRLSILSRHCLHNTSHTPYIPSTLFRHLIHQPITTKQHQHQRHFTSTPTLLSRRKRNFYEVLGLQTDADKKAVKAQFYKLSLEYHPDRNSADDTAHAKFLEISEAYSTLGNDAKRSEYDRSQAGYRAAHGYSSHTGHYGAPQTQGTGPRRGPRTYREEINPQDWILHRRKHNHTHKPGESAYNYTAHQDGHYGSAAEEAREKAKERRRVKNMYYNEMFEAERSQPRFVTVFALVLFGSFFLLHSGSMLFMEESGRGGSSDRYNCSRRRSSVIDIVELEERTCRRRGECDDDET